MIEKIKKFFKNFIKNNYKLLIFYIILILLFTVKLNYQIYSPGGLVNLNNRIEIDGSYKSKGSFNLTYVSGKNGIIPLILVSYIIPSWDLVSLNDNKIDNEPTKEIDIRNKIYLEEVNQNAVIVAFDALKKNYTVKEKGVVILHLSNYAKTNLKVKDTILSIGNIKVKDTEDLINIIDNLNAGDKVNIKVKRNDKDIDCYAYVKEEDNKKVLGLYLINNKEIITDPEVKFKFKNNELGPSGGLMTSLKIYDMLTKEDITNGKVISGTGTIASDGTVGEIDGVKYKLAGAVKNKADIFLCPTGNYKEALNLKAKNKYDIKIIEADTFKNTLKKLSEI